MRILARNAENHAKKKSCILTVNGGHTTSAEGAALPVHFLLPAIAVVPAVSTAVVTSQLGLTFGIC